MNRKYGVSKESAKKWADKIVEGYRSSPEYLKDKETWEKEFNDFFLYGIEPKFLNKDLLTELQYFHDKL